MLFSFKILPFVNEVFANIAFCFSVCSYIAFAVDPFFPIY